VKARRVGPVRVTRDGSEDEPGVRVGPWVVEGRDGLLVVGEDWPVLDGVVTVDGVVATGAGVVVV
jgi:hypothetical protein